MTMTVNLHGAKYVNFAHFDEASSVLRFSKKDSHFLSQVSMFVPPDVAEATAKAFNDAMAPHRAAEVKE